MNAMSPTIPERGTPEHDAWQLQICRNAFIYGHMGPGGIDLDKQDAIDADEDYEVFPTQSGSGR